VKALAAGNRVGEMIGVAARHDSVFRVADQQSMRGNQGQPLFEPGAAEQPKGAGLSPGGTHPFDQMLSSAAPDQHLDAHLKPPILLEARQSRPHFFPDCVSLLFWKSQVY